MKKYLLFISILFSLTFSTLAGNTPHNNIPLPDTLVIQRDSDDLEGFDILGEWDDPDDFDNFDDLYSEFNTSVIHPFKTDFSNKQDTTIIPLLCHHHSSFCCPMTNYTTSVFGPRRYRYHYGTDIKLNTGDTLFAAFDGKVRIAQSSKTYGNTVVIRHENGLESLYGHASELLVEPEMYVKAGTPVALGGSTGRSSGPHLHFEIRYLGAAINPETIIDFPSGRLKSDTLYLTPSTFKYLVEAKKLKEQKKAQKYHIVKQGDTLGHIARKYKTSVKNLCKLNKIKQTSTLRLKQKIRVK